MSYQIRLTKKAQKEIALLNNVDYERISTAIGTLSTHPRPIGSRKLRGHENDWRIRVGRIRILYSVDENIKAITIYRIADRKEAYRGI
ncbi:MAG: type II toxin-antitoxin system RelE/ParE family toxin [Nitrospirota bacterium]